MFPLARCPGPLLIRSEGANCFHTGLRRSGAVSRVRQTEGKTEAEWVSVAGEEHQQGPEISDINPTN